MRHPPLSALEKEYYLTQLAFWMSCLLFIAFEVKRSDFWQMLVHHFATIFLVGGSYALNYHRIGLLVQIFLALNSFAALIFLRVINCK